MTLSTTTAASIPLSHDDFYREFVARNAGLISQESQDTLRRTRFFIAGCGSTGGACVMPLLRSGAEHFVLLDPGTYELNNLNRQDATLQEIDMNKAKATAARILAVNPFADVQVHEEGVQTDVADRLRSGDMVVDAVDVTTAKGVQAKLALHDAACAAKLPVVTAYDIAGTQFIELFDYRRLNEPFYGRVRDRTSPASVLRALIPPWVVPREMFPELLARHADPARPFPQLAMTSTLFGAVVVPYLLRIIGGLPVRSRVRLDLPNLIRTRPDKVGDLGMKMVELPRLLWRLRG